jgi:hypothetical protein
MVVIAAVAVGILVEMPGGDNKSESSTRTEVTEDTATQFISFTINTLGGLDAYGECDDLLIFTLTTLHLLCPPGVANSSPCFPSRLLASDLGV